MNEEDPVALFLESRRRAVAAGAGFDGAAAVLATASPEGAPSVRWVLVKEVEADGFYLYTNYESRKARELDANPRAALAFHWPEIGEQFRVEGPAERAPAARSDAYHAARPRRSQLAASASPQSRPIASREALLARFEDVEARHGDGPIPRPAFWGGYRVVPERIERWIDGAHRLHDRFAYVREGDGWRRERLAP